MRIVRLLSCLLPLAAAPAFAADLMISMGSTFNLGTATQVFDRVSCMGTLELTPPAMVDAAMSVMLSNCTLRIDVPAGGMPMGDIVLIDNTGMAPVSGRFMGISQGMPLMFGTMTYYMDYTGGDGNDVVLSRMPVPTMPEMGGMMPMPMAGMGVQDMWWNPSESGWGMSLIEHGDSVFGALFVYDAKGNPTWAVMPAGSWDETHTILSGSIYTPHAAPFYSYNAAMLDVGAASGSVNIAFQDYNSATVDFSFAGMAGRKYVVRQAFGSGSTMYRDNTDLWWGGNAQSGWGVTVVQHQSTLFSVWFTYDANGAPAWYVMPGGAWTSDTTYEGRVYRTTGSPWSSYDPAQLQVADAGTYKLTLTASGMTFDYAVDGHTGAMALSRQPF